MNSDNKIVNEFREFKNSKKSNITCDANEWMGICEKYNHNNYEVNPDNLTKDNRKYMDEYFELFR